MTEPVPAPARFQHENADRTTIESRQGHRLSDLLAAIYRRNRFYTNKLDAAGLGTQLSTLRFPDDLARLPLTTKAEFVADQEAQPPWGTVTTEPVDRYTRYNQTSSTTGRPIRWCDTNESWQWMLECWKAVYSAARVVPGDRVFFPFSFGPFLGFWAAFDAGSQVGALCVPGGGLSSPLRLSLAAAVQASVVCCTPTYALHLAEVAAAEGLSLHDGPVRVLIVAGEPGGNVPATRKRIEDAWGARVIDHHGLTEVGPVSFECWEAPGFMHLNESRFLCEVLDPETLEPVPDGVRGELVVTSLGRSASPVLRYRTRDVVVRRSDPCPCGRSWARLEGGIVARDDDMVNVRGVNVYPTAIEAVLRDFHEIVEFRSTVSRSHEMRALSLEIEPVAGLADAAALSAAVARRLREALGLNVPVRVVAPQGLPRFEMKARRFVLEDERK
jgi:phenylacetate-CoA ligase